MTLSLQLNIYSNRLKLCDMLYIRKYIFISKFENSVILLKQNKTKNKYTKSSLKLSPLLYEQMHNYVLDTRRLIN
jgi:hypothetical protein